MKPETPILLAALLLAGAAAFAEEPMHHHHASEAAQPSADERQLVNYPPEVKAHALTNMRGHLQTLSAIMDALSKARYSEAADLADTRLGMNSEGAAGCRVDEPHNMSTMASQAEHMDHMMAQYMPEDMRKLGQTMHRSANDFATVARSAAKSGDGSAPLAALGKVMENCAACHARYRLN